MQVVRSSPRNKNQLGNNLLVPISMISKNDNYLEGVLRKNTSYFFLEPDEVQSLRFNTLNNWRISSNASGIQFVIGIWSRPDKVGSGNHYVIASIYQVTDAALTLKSGVVSWRTGRYLDSLNHADCRVGDAVLGLPKEFNQAQRFFIE